MQFHQTRRDKTLFENITRQRNRTKRNIHTVIFITHHHHHKMRHQTLGAGKVGHHNTSASSSLVAHLTCYGNLSQPLRCAIQHTLFDGLQMTHVTFFIHSEYCAKIFGQIYREYTTFGSQFN